MLYNMVNAIGSNATVVFNFFFYNIAYSNAWDALLCMCLIQLYDVLAYFLCATCDLQKKPAEFAAFP